MKKIIVGSLLFLCVTLSVYAQDYDDPFTKSINEGAIGSGYDDPFTEDINEGAIGPAWAEAAQTMKLSSNQNKEDQSKGQYTVVQQRRLSKLTD